MCMRKKTTDTKADNTTLPTKITNCKDFRFQQQRSRVVVAYNEGWFGSQVVNVISTQSKCPVSFGFEEQII